LIKAYFGEDKIVIPLNSNTGEPAGLTRSEFIPDGHFLSTKLPGGKPIKKDGTPGYTRVSAVICMEPYMRVMPSYDYIIDHNILIAHNPYSKHELPQNIWDDAAQLIRLGDSMQWNDGHGLYP
jgi:hypothetical protein